MHPKQRTFSIGYFVAMRSRPRPAGDHRLPKDLAEKRAILEVLAKRLIEKEVIDRDMLTQLIAETSEPAVPFEASSR